MGKFQLKEPSLQPKDPSLKTYPAILRLSFDVPGLAGLAEQWAAVQEEVFVQPLKMQIKLLSDLSKHFDMQEKHISVVLIITIFG